MGKMEGFIEVKQPNFHTKFLAPEALRGALVHATTIPPDDGP